MFCIGNTNNDFNINKNTINVNDYLDKKNLAQNKYFIEQEDLNIKLLNLNAKKFLED